MTVGEVTPASTSSDADAAEFVAGFRRVEAEIRAVAERELIPVNIDVPSAVATVLGSLPEIRAFRGEVSELPGVDLQKFDRLRDYALALGHAHAMYRAASGPADGVAELAEEVASIRDVLQADAMALAKRNILDAAQLSKLRGGNGYKNIAFEVVGLVGLFRDNWPRIIGRTALEPSELEHAGQLAQELVTAVGLREQQPAAVGVATSVRQRALTILVGAYDEARRAIAFLRWHEGDADDIAPSLYAGRTGRSDEVVPAPEGAAESRLPTPATSGTP